MNISIKDWIISERFDLPSHLVGAPSRVTPLNLMSGRLADELLEMDDYTLSADIWASKLLNPAREFLSVPGKSLRRDFVQLGWRLAWAVKTSREGSVVSEDAPVCPDELMTLIELLHDGSLIIDDIEDESETRRGQPCLHRKIGVAAALNIGNWLYFVAASMIDRLTCDELTRGHLHRALTRVMLRCHQGQALDLSCRITDVPRTQVRALTQVSTRLKSGVLVGFAMQLGSIYHGLTPEESSALYRFGEQIGLSLQMYDDLSGITNERRWNKGLEDLSRARLTWVWTWLAEHAEVTDHEFDALIDQLKRISELSDDSNNAPRDARSDDELEELDWRGEAHELRAHLANRLHDASRHISENIDLAIEGLTEQLSYPRLSSLAHHAIHKLKNSYL